MMTTWLPDLTAGSGPLYARLADRIETAIADGTLPPGTKLPPQRNLAYDLGVTIGTVGRSYALVHERGLVSGEVGRGTYVLTPNDIQPTAKADPVTAALSGTRPNDAPPGVIRFDTTSAPDVGQGPVLGQTLSDIVSEHGPDIASYTRTFPDAWYEAGSRWLTKGNFTPAPQSIVPTLGAHAAIMAVICAVTSPGDKIVFEHLTYSRISRSAGLIGRRTILVESDEFGMLPDDFERLCAQQHPKLAFLMPTAQNPTLATMPADRRRDIAEIARKHNVWLIEDDLYGALSDDETPLLSEFAPERTFLVGGLSKSVAAGVRGGWVACPAHLGHRVTVAHKMVTGGMPFLLAETCARLVLSGAADDIRNRAIREISARGEKARTVFAGCDFAARPGIPFLWLKLPDPWLSSTFKNAAFSEGVLVDDEDEFKAGRSDRVCHRVRIGFSSQPTQAEAAKGFHILRQLLDNASTGYDSYS